MLPCIVPLFFLPPSTFHDFPIETYPGPDSDERFPSPFTELVKSEGGKLSTIRHQK
jgi:hypothetical protein